MRLTTSGESHGKGLFAILEGVPAGLTLDLSRIDGALALRQGGYGRGGRQKIEKDHAEIMTGVRNCVTLGSPLTLAVFNRDFENWKPYMAPEGCDVSARRLTRVRPGHADLTGMIKFDTDDARNVLERASARETAARVAAGAVCMQLLEALGIRLRHYVRSVGSVADGREYSFEALQNKSPVLGMVDAEKEQKAAELIDWAREEGDTLGGTVELRVQGLKRGFGSCMTYHEKLDARLAAALMSVQAVKGVEVGAGFALASLPGCLAHDEIFYEEGRGYFRKSNRAGGIEGGMSNGEELVLRAAMKPIPTLMKGLQTVDTDGNVAARASTERSDVCAVTACGVVLESALAFELACVVLEQLGGSNMKEIGRRYKEMK